MKRIGTRTALAAVGAVALVGGGVAAWVATGTGIGTSTGTGGKGVAAAQRTAAVTDAKGRGEMTVAAAYLGLSRAQVRDDLRAGKTLAQIAATTPGRSTAGLIEALIAARTDALGAALSEGKISASAEHRRLERLRARVTEAVDRARPHAGALPGVQLDAAAHYLGVSTAQLRVEVQAGHTLAAIAQSTPGRSVAGLVAALLASRQSRLEAAAGSGKLSRKREERQLRTLRQRVEASVRGGAAG
jgi:hypothetical protein